jgi:hypothetical protein
MAGRNREYRSVDRSLLRMCCPWLADYSGGGLVILEIPTWNYLEMHFS